VTRKAIVSLAEQQIGQVYAADRGDKRKYGWERILRYYIDGNVEVQSVAASDHWTVEHVSSYFKAMDD